MAEPTEIRKPQLFAVQQQPEIDDQGLGLLDAIAALLTARILALIALVGSIGVWMWAAYDPSTLRLYAGLGISLGVLVPCLWYAHKRG